MTTTIEWTDATWNPLVGCSRVSKGCENCYAERVAHRGMSAQHRGLTVLGKKGPRWTGEVRFLAAKLAEPLGWKRPLRIFVNSMSDLFHEAVSNETIAAIFGVMAACPQHTFQVLTKRPERAREWFRWVDRSARFPGSDEVHDPRRLGVVLMHAQFACPHRALRDTDPIFRATWPLPNVWLGVSVEDQATADERIPTLLETPAALRWISFEPALGPVGFARWLARPGSSTACSHCGAWASAPCAPACPSRARRKVEHHGGLDWIVVGGESGPGARPFDLGWARSTVEACRAAGVPCFVKQLGARPTPRKWTSPTGLVVTIESLKGGDPNEWPADLRVREWPGERHA